jgi:hypothetical protein
MAKPTVTQSCLLETMCSLGGGKFRGILDAFLDKNQNLVEAVCLFDSPDTFSTLALPVSKLSARAVRAAIRKSNARFEHFQKKATANVLRQFSAKPVRIQIPERSLCAQPVYSAV